MHGGGHARKFSDDVGKIDKKTGDHDEESGTEAKFLADEIGEAFAGNDAHAGAHFLGDVEGNGHRNESPEEGVAIGGAGLRISDDATGVVIDVRGDDAGADDGKE